ncbi:MAG: replicative DNA helicase [Victivallaceae bacterium]|nr:replicative DNA helicase [Victivallaceae bacterium]
MNSENYNKKQRTTKYPSLISGEQPLPHNLEAERAIISAMLREPDSCIDMGVENLGDEKMFFSHVYRELFKVLVKLKNSTTMEVDLITLAHYLSNNNRLEEIGGEIFLAEIYDAIPTTANFDAWCEIVRELSQLRAMINICTESVGKCYNSDEPIGSLIDEIEHKIFKIRHGHSKEAIIVLQQQLKSTFANLMDILNNKVEPGIPTQYPDLNKLVYGFKPGEMFVLAARPSIGKTTLALNFIRHVALNGNHNYPVAFFSLEMTAEQITRRLLCTEANIQEKAFFDHTFKSSEINNLTAAVGRLQQAKIFIDPTGSLDVSELRSKARRLKAEHDIKLIAIDYLQLMKAKGNSENRQNEVAAISSGIKALAKELNIPILVLAQLNRDIEKSGAGALPKLSHLRESGSIEQDADVVAFLHRDRDQAKNRQDEDITQGLESLFIVEKNRNGQTGIVKMLFFPERMEFVSQSRFGEADRPEG